MTIMDQAIQAQPGSEDIDLLGRDLEAAQARYAASNPLSRQQHEAACLTMPGGNTRSVLFHEPFPLVIERGEGACLWDRDGHRYVDFIGDFTSGLYGHSDQVIRDAIRAALDAGLSLSGHNMVEQKLATLITDRFPSIDLVRFTNSGTEANLMALGAARIHTGRDKVIVFAGGYHGGLLTFAGPAPLNVPLDFVLGEYNDIAGTLALIEAHGPDLAAILIEPMQGAAGCIPATPEFLHALREAATRSGAVLIFDEVQTSRLSTGGRQLVMGITPDMTTLGKYIGGGLSFGAFGGSAAIMAMFDPRDPNHVAHSGTFNNNILSMAAGAAGLSQVLSAERLRDLNARGEVLRERLNALCVEHDAAMQFIGLGSMFTMHPTRAPISSVADLSACDPAERDLFYFYLLSRGIYIARRGFFALMLPIEDADCDLLVDIVRDYLEQRRLPSDAKSQPR